MAEVDDVITNSPDYLFIYPDETQEFLNLSPSGNIIIDSNGNIENGCCNITTGYIDSPNIQDLVEKIEKMEQILLFLGKNLDMCPLKVLIEELKKEELKEPSELDNLFEL